MKLTSKDLINTYIENDNGKLLKLYMETCASVGLHVFHDGDEAFDAEFYRDGLFIACTEHSVPSSEGVLQLLMTEDDLGYELTWEELAKMNIDNLATQTPEEKEALDLIDTTPHQYEMSKFSGEPEWENGDELDWLTPDNKWCMCEHLFIGESSGGSPVIEHKATGNMFETYWSVIRKPETPQQREERERLEAAYDLYCVWVGDRAGYHAIDFDKWKVEPDFLNKWLRIVDKTNYRKESN